MMGRRCELGCIFGWTWSLFHLSLSLHLSLTPSPRLPWDIIHTRPLPKSDSPHTLPLPSLPRHHFSPTFISYFHLLLSSPTFISSRPISFHLISYFHFISFHTFIPYHMIPYHTIPYLSHNTTQDPKDDGRFPFTLPSPLRLKS